MVTVISSRFVYYFQIQENFNHVIMYMIEQIFVNGLQDPADYLILEKWLSKLDTESTQLSQNRCRHQARQS